MNNFEQFHSLESTQTFFQWIPDNCKQNILEVINNDSSTRKILEYYLFDNWTHIMWGWLQKGIKKLTAKEYILCLEIISEANGIPHRFNSLLFRIFYDWDKQWFEKMRDPELVQRTTLCIQKIMFKMDLELNNPYSPESEKYKIFNKTLTALRRQKTRIDYSDYNKAKEYHGKYELLRRECDKESRRKFDMEN